MLVIKSYGTWMYHTTIIRKLNAITGSGRLVVDNVKPRGNNYYSCNKILSDREYCSSSYKSVYFCGKHCKIQFWKDHKQVYKAILTLAAQRQEEISTEDC